ncbi:hypothetical protein P7C70_g7460, partial [Phenoliferia sp. Uapishka_3]
GELGDEDDPELDPEEGENEEEGAERVKYNGRWQHPAWLTAQFNAWKAFLNSTRDPTTSKCAVHRPLTLSPSTPLLRFGLGTCDLPHQDELSFLGDASILQASDLYNPRWFFWDPLPLERLKCPACECYLSRNGYPSRPRRAVDLEETWYIIGMRYQCSKRKESGCGRGYMSYDSRLLSQLPQRIQNSFHFRLSWRSAITQRAFNTFRATLSRGLGTTQFSDIMAELHLLRHDRKHIAYREAVRDLPKKTGQTFEPFGTFDDPERNSGFVPSGTWLSLIYNLFIEANAAVMDQHTAMLPLTIGSIDHSHKIVKWILQLAGVMIFAALLTVVNQVGEIRSINLVPTKAHSAFASALLKLRKSLHIFGHPQPLVFYTDNVAGDSQFLRESFPSLNLNVKTPSKWEDLPPFLLSPTSPPIIIDTFNEAESVLQFILEQTSDNLEALPEVVGFDAEWAVTLVYGAQGVIVSSKRGDRVALVQLAWRKNTYLFQLAKIHRTTKKLPPALLKLITNRKILKAGVNVQGDLTLVLKDFGRPSSEAAGATELAQMALERGLLQKSASSLEDLTAIVLERHLEKDEGIRVSPEWEADALPPAHALYAAKDARSSLEIFEKLFGLPIVPSARLSEEDLASGEGMRVLLLQADQVKPVARGVIELVPPPSSKATQSRPASIPLTRDNIKLTPSRVVFRVTEVLIPGAKASEYNSGADSLTGGRPLSSFPSVPFSMVVRHSDLRADSPFASEHSPRPTPTSKETNPPPPPPPTSSSSLPIIIDTADPNSREGALQEEGDEEDPLSNSEIDKVSAAEGLVALSAAEDDYDAARQSGFLQAETAGGRVDGRVKVDAWHLMDRIYVPKRHGALWAFMRAFSDTLFVPRAAERALLTARFEREGKNWNEERKYRPQEVWKRVPRDIEAPETLHPNLVKLFRVYGPIKDAKTGAPLFNDEGWKSAKRVLTDVLAGHVSDVPGVALYFPIAVCGGKDGKTRDGVLIQHCARGTGGAEGGVHKPIKDQFPKGGVSVRHAAARLKDFTLRHNLRVGTRNRTGQRYSSHYDIWEFNTLQRLQVETRDRFPCEPPLEGWVNGDLYTQAEESFGILPIPAALVDELQLPPHENSEFTGEAVSTATRKSKKPPRRSPYLHNFLARVQGTRFAVIHIHTPEERILFGELSKHRSVTSVGESKRWIVMARIWVGHADGKTVFYKLPEHLEAYSKQREKNLNEKQTLQAGPAEREIFDKSMSSVSRKASVAPTFNAAPVPPPLSKGLRPASEIPVTIKSHPRVQNLRPTATPTPTPGPAPHHPLHPATSSSQSPQPASREGSEGLERTVKPSSKRKRAS